MAQDTGANDGNVAHRHTARTVSQSPDRLTGAYPLDVEGTELDVYPTQTESEAAVTPDQKHNVRLARLKALWRREISLVVEPRACRDHLANERTFLVWLRTSLLLSMTGIYTTQIFVLQSIHLPHMSLSFFVLAVPLGSICQVAAIVNMFVGAYRFWRHQRAIVRGQALAGGWEILFIGALITIVSRRNIERAICLADFVSRSYWRSSPLSLSVMPTNTRREHMIISLCLNVFVLPDSDIGGWLSGEVRMRPYHGPYRPGTCSHAPQIQNRLPVLICVQTIPASTTS
jgi:uncharacterized membrane protein YidH (DUF202 family)